MNFFASLGLKVLTAALPNAVDAVTPELREALIDVVDRYWAKAQATEGKIDNIIVKVVAALIQHPLPK